MGSNYIYEPLFQEGTPFTNNHRNSQPFQPKRQSNPATGYNWNQAYEFVPQQIPPQHMKVDPYFQPGRYTQNNLAPIQQNPQFNQPSLVPYNMNMQIPLGQVQIQNPSIRYNSNMLPQIGQPLLAFP
mmetsp:Transcript_39159/g.37501  ORF Transcript_39159/g.37501 Transcript_39159/m.37501 type:complete len:127 (-) Transcript_39159:1542-1922(-)